MTITGTTTGSSVVLATLIAIGTLAGTVSGESISQGNAHIIGVFNISGTAVGSTSLAILDVNTVLVITKESIITLITEYDSIIS